MKIEIARIPTEDGKIVMTGIEIHTKAQLTEYYNSGLAELNDQLHDIENGLSDCQRAYGLVLLSALNEYVTEAEQPSGEGHNSMNICRLLAEETVMADIAGKNSMLDVRLQEFSECNPETWTAAYLNLIKEIAEESGTREYMREYIRKWSEQYSVPAHETEITLRHARHCMLKQTAVKQEELYRNLLCFDIERVIYSEDRTIMLFGDGTKTMATCSDGDVYSRETGLLICLLKHLYGNGICKLLNDFAEETEKAERNESELVYIQNGNKNKTKKADTAEVK